MQNIVTLVGEIPVGQLDLSQHAQQRMRERNLPRNAIRAALDYGRVVHTRGASIHAIGRKEVESAKHHGVDLSGFEGVQVVCSTDGKILTAYRNRDFRGLRPSKRRPYRQWSN